MSLFPSMVVPLTIKGRNAFVYHILCHISPLAFSSWKYFTYMSSLNISTN